jgi:CBS domain-containing protein
MADVRVADVMTRDVVVLHPRDTIHEAAVRLARNGISGAPVLDDEGHVVGIVSESDLIHAVMPRVGVDRGVSVLDLLSVIGRGRFPKHDAGTRVGDIMTEIVIELTPETSIWKAASTMERRGVKRLPVVDRTGALVGILSRADLVKAMARDDKEITAEVVEAIEELGTETIEDLEVTVAEGVTTLRGRADRSSTKSLAVQIAGRIPGVVKVVDRLTSIIDDSHLAKVRLETDPKDPRLDWRQEEAVDRGAR